MNHPSQAIALYRDAMTRQGLSAESASAPESATTKTTTTVGPASATQATAPTTRVEVTPALTTLVSGRRPAISRRAIEARRRSTPAAAGVLLPSLGGAGLVHVAIMVGVHVVAFFRDAVAGIGVVRKSARSAH